MSSTQSILELSRERYADENEDTLLQMSDAYFYSKYYMVGKKTDSDRIQHTLLFHRILNNCECPIVNFIENKLHGKLEECTGKKSAKKRVSKILRELKEHTGKDEQCCLEEAKVVWSISEW